MNGVIGMTRPLLDTPLSDEQREYVEAVHDSGPALLTIINDLLDLTRMEAGRLELDSIDFDLEKLVDRTRAIVEPKARGKELTLDVEIGPEVPRMLHGDPGRLRQILLNLLGNGVKFTERGGVRLIVHRLEERDDRVRLAISVQDTRHRHSREPPAPPVHRFHPGRPVGRAAVRRKRPGPDDLQGPRRADGW